jgi:hypothetical protein
MAAEPVDQDNCGPGRGTAPVPVKDVSLLASFHIYYYITPGIVLVWALLTCRKYVKWYTIYKSMLKNRPVRILLALLLIYVAWSAYVNIADLHRCVDNDALIPCLFYLPPLGFLALGLIAAKIIESTAVLGLIKKFFRKKK